MAYINPNANSILYLDKPNKPKQNTQTMGIPPTDILVWRNANMRYTLAVAIFTGVLALGLPFAAKAQEAKTEVKRVTCIQDLPNLTGWEKFKLEARLAARKAGNATRKATGIATLPNPCLD
ncbi:MAG: hypothetical protein EBR79_03250, partial [Proteobacteria bacterium]|nr:hypothetical protein [Pseudomonadota bacterium]